ncbi:MAG: cryptochrome/photolyase family protein [Bacteroidales bacterium]
MNKPEQPINLFWFRRDLRLEDNHGLYRALTAGLPVLPIFIFDTQILDKLEDSSDARVTFIHRQISHLHKQLAQAGSSLWVDIGKPIEVFQKLLNHFHVHAVYTNHDYEPYATARDQEVEQWLKAHGVSFHTFKDQVIFEKNEVLKPDGTPYTVFTPYSKAWKSMLTPPESYPSEKHLHALLSTEPFHLPGLEEVGFKESDQTLPSSDISEEIIRTYDKTRDFPAMKGTTRLGMHLRFGTVSIRHLVRIALHLNPVYLNELIWREFYMMILWHFPYVTEGAFKPEYNTIPWLNREEDFEAWKAGRTGYPMVDAGMRELAQTGYMHNRLRMITASFLTKHLLVDWRWGEAWFAQKLLDFELASNNGGWQWAAGTGVDAAPYFRIFNPSLQAQRFDPKGEYIRRWIPELDTGSYPYPIIEHTFARDRALKAYKKALQ